jgi:hypothetical protein
MNPANLPRMRARSAMPDRAPTSGPAALRLTEYRNRLVTAISKLNDLDTQRAAMDNILVIIKVREWLVGSCCRGHKQA